MIAKAKLCAFMVNCKEIANNKAVLNTKSKPSNLMHYRTMSSLPFN